MGHPKSNNDLSISNAFGLSLEYTAQNSKCSFLNFTTKNSGTGLGLAIVRDIVDSCNGHIYFTTVENKGTEFFVEFPLMHMEDNFKIIQRVSL